MLELTISNYIFHKDTGGNDALDFYLTFCLTEIKTGSVGCNRTHGYNTSLGYACH